MDRHISYPFSFSIPCRHTGKVCEASYVFALTLAQSVGKAHSIVGDDFSTSGFAEIRCSDQPCTIGWHCSKDETFVFGDVDMDQDLDELLDLARQILGSPNSGQGPSRPVEVPAFMLALETQDVLNKALAA